MSSSDPSLPAAPEPDPREHITANVPAWDTPPGSPLDRPPLDGPAPPLVRHGYDDAHGPGYPDFDREPPAVLPPRKPHPHLGWAILWMLGFMIVTQIGGSVITVVLFVLQIILAPNRDELLKLSFNEILDSPQGARMMWPGMLITEIITIVFALAALRIIAGSSWTRKVALRLPSFPHLLVVLLMVPGFMLVGQGVDEIAKRYVPNWFGDLDQMMGMIGYWPWWLGILIIGVGPGLGEELFCRAFLGRGLVANHGYILGVVFTSILFGVMHVVPRQVIYAPVMGVVLHYVYITTRSLLMPMLIHALNNGVSSLTVWSDKSDCMPDWVRAVTNAGNQPSFLFVYAGAVVLLLAGMAGLYLSRARLMGADGGPPPWQPGYPTVEYPPAYAETVVARPFNLGLVGLGITLLGMLSFVVCCFAAYQLG